MKRKRAGKRAEREAEEGTAALRRGGPLLGRIALFGKEDNA